MSYWYSYWYSDDDINGMIAAGIISDPNEEPSISDILFIQRQHKCKLCDSTVKFVKKKNGGPREYTFVCNSCGFIHDDAPLKNKK